MDSDNDNDFLDNVDSGNVSSGDDGDDDFAMEVDMPSSTERQLDTDDHQYKVLTTDEIVQYQREIIDEVNRVLKVSHTYFHAVVVYLPIFGIVNPCTTDNCPM